MPGQRWNTLLFYLAATGCRQMEWRSDSTCACTRQAGEVATRSERLLSRSSTRMRSWSPSCKHEETLPLSSIVIATRHRVLFVDMSISAALSCYCAPVACCFFKSLAACGASTRAALGEVGVANTVESSAIAMLSAGCQTRQVITRRNCSIN